MRACPKPREFRFPRPHRGPLPIREREKKEELPHAVTVAPASAPATIVRMPAPVFA